MMMMMNKTKMRMNLYKLLKILITPMVDIIYYNCKFTAQNSELNNTFEQTPRV